ncbi:MAG: hypothetical protein ACRC26_10415 [Bacteroidales bacterium]
MRKFDLNIEKILENWDTHHAIRELIANALDEQFLTQTKDVEIVKNNNVWKIRDFGRGIKHIHLTQNENQEKIKNPNLIGKFGIGLKDALATLDRNQIEIIIRSKHCQITTRKSEKEGFNDLITLHAIIEEPLDPQYEGTEIELRGVSDKDIEDAKNLFLKFSGEEIIEKTKLGCVVKKGGKYGNIYINGVKVAEEENFLYSYNITVINAAIKKALNRERTNVGRTAYTDSIKKIILASVSKTIAEGLANDLGNINKGNAHDELTWIDVQEHSVKILNQLDKYLFISSSEAIQYPDMIQQAQSSGHKIIIIPENLKSKIHNSSDISGNPIVDLGQFISDYNDSFTFNFIEPSVLDKNEYKIYDMTDQIIDLFGGKPQCVKHIKISTTMRKDFLSDSITQGCWDPAISSIVLSRVTLKSIESYSGVLIHELIHAKTGENDVSRAFENSLTRSIGSLCKIILEAKKVDAK